MCEGDEQWSHCQYCSFFSLNLADCDGSIFRATGPMEVSFHLGISHYFIDKLYPIGKIPVIINIYDKFI